jgi:hypothetical protein
LSGNFTRRIHKCGIAKRKIKFQVTGVCVQASENRPPASQSSIAAMAQAGMGTVRTRLPFNKSGRITGQGISGHSIYDSVND